MQGCVGKLCSPMQVAQDSESWTSLHSLCPPGRSTRGGQTPQAGSHPAIPPRLRWGWGRSSILTPPRSWPDRPTPPGFSLPRKLGLVNATPGTESLLNAPASPWLPRQEPRLGLEADGCLSLASILLPSGRWQAVGTTFPGLIPEYFSAHRKFFVTFPLL